MTPEPGHRTRKRYNETRPLTIRVGAIRDELDARSDGTEAGYRAVITRDLKRYYEMLAQQLEDWGSPTSARSLYERWQREPDTLYGPGPATIDALERARVLVDHAGLTVDAALVSVGLVKEEK